jgi:hypothetical protein
MRFVAFRPMPFERLLRSNEAEHTAPAPAEAWLLSQKRRKFSLVVDEPRHRRRRSHPAPHRDFQPPYQKDLS